MIIFSKRLTSSFLPIYDTQTGTFTPSPSGPGSNSYEEVLPILQSSKTGASLSDSLVSFPEHSLEVSYISAEMQSTYSTAPVDWAIYLLDFKVYECIQKETKFVFLKTVYQWDVFVCYQLKCYVMVTLTFAIQKVLKSSFFFSFSFFFFFLYIYTHYAHHNLTEYWINFLKLWYSYWGNRKVYFRHLSIQHTSKKGQWISGPKLCIEK